MPRPKQPDSRTLVAGFRVSPQEQQVLQSAADRQGISISDLLRLTVLGKASGNKQQA
jgi:uncharacterized protein (DUF1778 family)